MDQILKRLYNVQRVDINSGNIDRDGDGFVSQVDPMPNGPAHQIPHIEIQISDKSIAFQQRDKIARRDHAALRMNPTHQGFQADDLTGGHVAFRLSIKSEFFLFQCMLDLRKKNVVVFHLLHHTAVIPAGPLIVISFDGRHGDRCPIIHGPDRGMAV